MIRALRAYYNMLNLVKLSLNMCYAYKITFIKKKHTIIKENSYFWFEKLTSMVKTSHVEFESEFQKKIFKKNKDSILLSKIFELLFTYSFSFINLSHKETKKQLKIIKEIKWICEIFFLTIFREQYELYLFENLEKRHALIITVSYKQFSHV